MKGRKMVSALINRLRFYLYPYSPKEKEFLLLKEKYIHAKRYDVQRVRYLNYSLTVPDVLSFVWQVKNIFVDEAYKFKTSSYIPVIFDCGANIGLSSIYFKSLYPQAKIYAFEADPKVFSYLSSNLMQNNIMDVLLFNKAVWDNEGIAAFSSEGADGGTFFSGKNRIDIETIKLRDFLKKEEAIDLLKLDIEGSEVKVLCDCADQLYRVKFLFVEYHSLSNGEQELEKILQVLKQSGFRYYIVNENARRTPFIGEISSFHFDLMLNIYAYR